MNLVELIDQNDKCCPFLLHIMRAIHDNFLMPNYFGLESILLGSVVKHSSYISELKRVFVW